MTTMLSSMAIPPHRFCIASSIKTAKFGSSGLPWTFIASTWRWVIRMGKYIFGNWTHPIRLWRASTFCRTPNARPPFDRPHFHVMAIFWFTCVTMARFGASIVPELRFFYFPFSSSSGSNRMRLIYHWTEQTKVARNNSLNDWILIFKFYFSFDFHFNKSIN